MQNSGDLDEGGGCSGGGGDGEKLDRLGTCPILLSLLYVENNSKMTG